MFRILSKLSVLLVLVMVFVACSKDEGDKEAPTAEIIKPEAGKEYFVGRPLPLEAKFYDNEALKACEILLTYNGAAKSAVLKGLESPWDAINRGDAIIFDGDKAEMIVREPLCLNLLMSPVPDNFP